MARCGEIWGLHDTQSPDLRADTDRSQEWQSRCDDRRVSSELGSRARELP